MTYVIVALPHGREVAPDDGHDEDGDEGEGDQVEQSRLSRVHQEEAHKSGDQAQGVSWKVMTGFYWLNTLTSKIL